MKYIPNFRPVKLMSDAAPAIFNGLSEIYPTMKQFWLAERNEGWHSGLVPGTVTTNNGLEVTNRVFKKNFKGMSNFHCYFL
jgi:hypothetical protein